MWLNNINNNKDYNLKNLKNKNNKKETLKWEIKFKNWIYEWEYYIDEYWEKIENWDWKLILKDYDTIKIYSWKFENWYFVQWTFIKGNWNIKDDWKVLSAWIFDKKWNLLKWISVFWWWEWDWEFKDWKLFNWTFKDLITWEKTQIINWEKVKNLKNNPNIVDEEINKKIDNTLKSLREVENNIFERLLKFFYWISNSINEKTAAINHWIEIIWELKRYLLAVEEFKDDAFDLSKLSNKIQEKTEELNFIFNKYCFDEYRPIFNNFMNYNSDLIESLNINISKHYKENNI